MARTIQNISNRVIIPKTCRERFLPLDRPALRPLRDLGVESAGLSDLVAPFRIGRVAPGFHVAIFTVGGGARWRSTHASGAIKPGTLTWASATGTYEYWAAPRWRVAWFHLHGRSFHNFAAQPLSCRRSDAGERMAAAFAGLLAETHRPERDAERALRAYADVLAVLLSRELRRDDEAESPYGRELDALWQRVEANLQHPWRVEELAAELHVSIVHFHRLMARRYKTSPLVYLTRLRMQRAADFLLQTDYKLHHIAQLVGFQTPFSFSRAFKQHTGSSPRSFRRK